MHRHHAISLVALLTACGSEPTPPAPTPSAPAVPAAAPAPAPAAASEEAAAASEEAAAPTPAAPVGPPVDLLHATRASVATSSAYRDDDAQVEALVDGSLETAWNSRTEDLTGAWIEVRLPGDASVTSIGLTAGFTHVSARADLFVGNHRVARVRVLHDGVELGTFPLDVELRTMQTLPVTGGGGVYRIELTELVPGARTDWREACVSELVVMGHAPGASAASTGPALAIGALPPLPEPGELLADVPEEDGMYFTVQGRGLVHLSADGMWDVIVPGNVGHLRPTYDGHALASDGTHVFRSNGEPIAAPEGMQLFDIAPAPDGTVWVTGGGRYAHHDGSSWTLSPPPRRSGPSYGYIAVDGQGTVWFTTGTQTLARLRDGVTEPVAIDVESSIDELGVDRAGRVWFRHGGGAVRREGETFVPFAPPRSWSAAERADGTSAWVDYDGVTVSAPGAAPRRIDMPALGLPSSRPQSAGWDGAGRLWIATTVGLVVLEASLDRVARWYPRGTVEELVSDSSVHGIVGVGTAPSLPPAAPAYGHVRGRVTRDGAPLAGAWILFCEAPSRRLEDEATPCGRDLSHVPSARTAADGAFDILDVDELEGDAVIQASDETWYIREVDGSGDPEHLRDLGVIEVHGGEINRR